MMDHRAFNVNSSGIKRKIPFSRLPNLHYLEYSIRTGRNSNILSMHGHITKPQNHTKSFLTKPPTRSINFSSTPLPSPTSPPPPPHPQHYHTNPLFRLAFLVFAGRPGYITGGVQQRQALARLSLPLADLVDEVVEFVEVLFLGVIRRCVFRGADIHPVIVIAPLVTVLVVPLSTKGGRNRCGYLNLNFIHIRRKE